MVSNLRILPSFGEMNKMKPSENKFKCANCGDEMSDWKSGSKCSTCSSSNRDKAMTPTGKKPAGGAAKKPAGGGRVQDEFPSCPGCGRPTKDGDLCDHCVASRESEAKMGELTYAQQQHSFRGEVEDAAEEEERREIRRLARRNMARLLGLDEDELKKAAGRLANQPPTVLKSAPDKRFSYAPMYMPGKLDAHDEFVKSADELQEAAWEYVRKTGHDRTVYLQHIDKPAGEWVEITSWPYAVEAPMTMPNGQVRKATFPAGTVYMGTIWEPWAWELVRKGRLLGYSMGGWAKRVEAQLMTEAEIAKHASHDQQSHGNRASGGGQALTDSQKKYLARMGMPVGDKVQHPRELTEDQKKYLAHIGMPVGKAVRPGSHDNGEDWTEAGVANPQSPALTGKLPAYDPEVAQRLLDDAAPFVER